MWSLVCCYRGCLVFRSYWEMNMTPVDLCHNPHGVTSEVLQPDTTESFSCYALFSVANFLKWKLLPQTITAQSKLTNANKFTYIYTYIYMWHSDLSFTHSQYPDVCTVFHFWQSNYWMPAICVLKRSHHLPLLSFVGLMFEACFPSQWSLDSLLTKDVYSCVRSLFLYSLCKLFDFLFFHGTAAILILPKKEKKKKRLEVVLVFCLWAVGVWVHSFSLIPRTVPGETGSFLSYFVFSCSLFHQTVTKSPRVTSTGSLYEPSHRGLIDSVTASPP